MIVFFFLFLTIFSLEKSEGASFLKEGVREGIYFAKGFKSTYRAFSQARDLSNFLTSVELTSKRFGTTLRPIPHGYYGSEERSLPFALLTLGACGVSLFVNQNIKSEGRDTELKPWLWKDMKS